MPRSIQALTEPMTASDRALAKADRAAWKDMDRRIAELREALGKALDYCDSATHADNQYHDERSSLIRIYSGE